MLYLLRCRAATLQQCQSRCAPRRHLRNPPSPCTWVPRFRSFLLAPFPRAFNNLANHQFRPKPSTTFGVKLEICRTIFAGLFQDGGVSTGVLSGSDEGGAVVDRLVCDDPAAVGGVVSGNLAHGEGRLTLFARPPQ